jgi:hypothetical protein
MTQIGEGQFESEIDRFFVLVGRAITTWADVEHLLFRF